MGKTTAGSHEARCVKYRVEKVTACKVVSYVLALKWPGTRMNQFSDSLHSIKNTEYECKFPPTTHERKTRPVICIPGR